MALSDGLYSVVFQTPLGAGAGVIVLEDGIARGGDAGMFYVGNYQQDADGFSATISIDRHANIGGVVSVFGHDKVTINLVGTSKVDEATVQGSSPQAPGIQFSARLRKVA